MSLPKRYSVRMRASGSGRHISGAERIVQERHLPDTVQQCVRRALDKGLQLDQIVVTIEALVETELRDIRALDLIDLAAGDVPLCRNVARSILAHTGVTETAIDTAMKALERGPARSGGNMRGAMVIDARTGERLEGDHDRGIRASHFDWSDNASASMDSALAEKGLTHVRTKEALALASKVANAPGIVAELCWSDDPDYTAGYVASPSCGYVRLSHLKRTGDPFGGRAFFVDRALWNADAFRIFLEETPVLIMSVGSVQSGDTSLYRHTD